ncbi:TPA: tail fiber assembly protein [Citrobacter freundii]|uniref:tail fiber assembly protein n=1 Tax=Citrobacter TaxID=544 RepID=UPI0008FD325A|nr:MULTISPECIES: tail fiber assembly protein [Citrobacter]EKX5705288.1 tail fiber assembly protein [Citrobacter freundii]EKY0068602.1 tail fiber assembly protein [Citrobacter freundii]EKY0340649.1 tail fiber assembly protein [Citrobacter freundii]MDE9636340.1 tail fiber assembly protein [Citrobacter freundii]MDH0217261.1 tail fiber assembly protein [Citrobacter freundii]
MKHLKNIVAGNAKTPDQFQLTKRFGVIWLFSADGKNWYEEQKNFSADTIKIAYDKNNVIVGINKDVSTIHPDGLSVVEVPDITANRRADASGNWMFLDDRVIKRIYTPDELRQQAEAKKTRLLADATPRINWLEDAQKDGDISADEETELTAMRAYRTALRRLDLSAAPEINWPVVPDLIQP